MVASMAVPFCRLDLPAALSLPACSCLSHIQLAQPQVGKRNNADCRLTSEPALMGCCAQTAGRMRPAQACAHVRTRAVESHGRAPSRRESRGSSAGCARRLQLQMLSLFQRSHSKRQGKQVCPPPRLCAEVRGAAPCLRCTSTRQEQQNWHALVVSKQALTTQIARRVSL